MQDNGLELLLVAIITAGKMPETHPSRAAEVFTEVQKSLVNAKIIGPHSALRRDEFQTGS